MSIKFEKVLCPVEFEQNSAAALRFACELAQPNGRLYLLHVVPGEAGTGVSATSQLARECLEDFVRERGVTDVNPKLLIRIGDPAEAIVNVARHFGEKHVVLSGGCFQNRYLTERAVHRLQAEGFRVFWHRHVPPNDGGIALGQIIAAWRLNGKA